MSKLVKLKSILTYEGLSSGYSFRGKIKNDSKGTIEVVQLKNIKDDYLTINNNCVKVDSKKIKERHYLSVGDILFIAKGSNNFALPFYQKSKTAIASSAFFVLKVDTQIADPNYIAWYINQKKVQNYFKTNSGGTYTMSINKKTLEEAPIILPNIEKQRTIAKIAKLYHKEQQLYKRIATLKKETTQYQLLKSL